MTQTEDKGGGGERREGTEDGGEGVRGRGEGVRQKGHSLALHYCMYMYISPTVQ